jgi:hypothetical protein
MLNAHRADCPAGRKLSTALPCRSCGADSPHKRPSFAVRPRQSVGSIFYLFRMGEQIGFLLFIFGRLAVEGGANLLRFNSRFGEFNSRLGWLEFPVRAATGIGWQRLDLPHRFRGHRAVVRGKSAKFPVSTGKTGNVVRRAGGTGREACHPLGQSWRIGSLPSQSMAASRTASKMRRRVCVSSAISMTVPGWPSLRK